MQGSQTDANHRLFFFDNLRYLLVLLVVVFHSVLSYSHAGSWWPVDDRGAGILFFGRLVFLLDTFLMPGLFFIAGYFALVSHEGKTTREFIKRKLKRLGVPWLIGVVLFNPIALYISNMSRGDNSFNLTQCFIYKMKSAFIFYTGTLYSSRQFNQYHLWFISLLLLFFILFAIGRKIKNKVFSKATRVQSGSPSSFSILGAIFLALILSFGINMVLSVQFPLLYGRSWILIGNIIQFKIDRIALLTICFCLGIYAHHKNWFSNKKVPGHILLWMILSMGFGYGFIENLYSLIAEFTPDKGMAYLFLFPAFVFSVLLMLLSLGVQYWNSSSKINRILSDSSYNIYLIHLMIVFFAQWAMLAWFEFSIYIKAIGVFAFSVLISLLISHYGLKKSPTISVTGIVGAFALLVLLLK